MTFAKTLFQRKEPGKQSLAEWWVTVCHDERFQMVCMHARADAFEEKMPYEQLVGAGKMLEKLATFADNEETFETMPGPGLVHVMPTKAPYTRTPEKKD